MTPHAPNQPDTSPVQTILTAFLNHLARYELPDPGVVNLGPGIRELVLQPHYIPRQELPDLVAELLSWAASLHGSTVELVRLSKDIHLHLTGRLDTGHPVTLYTHAPEHLLTDHADALHHRGRVVLPLATLRSWSVVDGGVIA